MLVKLRVCIEQVIRPDYSGIAAGISTADITLFQHRHIGNTVQSGQIICGGQAMSPATDDDHIVLFFGLWISPGSGPPTITRQCVLDQARVVSRGAAARLGESAGDGEASVFRKIQVRHQFPDAVEIVHHSIDAI